MKKSASYDKAIASDPRSHHCDGSHPSLPLESNRYSASDWPAVAVRLAAWGFAATLPGFTIALCLCALPEATYERWLSEAGLIESASGWGHVLLASGMLAAGALCWVRRGSISSWQTMPRHPILLGSCVALLAAREADWHKLWTTRNVLKTSFYVDPEIAATEKLAVVAVLGLIGTLLVTMVRAHRIRFLDRLRNRERSAYCAAAAIMLIPLSKAIDSGMSIFTSLLPIDALAALRLMRAVEESTELMIPTLLLISAFAAVWSGRSTAMPADTAEPQATSASTRRAA